jgi:hypothetical protein
LDEKSNNDFFFQIQVLPVIRNETEVLNLKTRKIQVPLGYFTQKKKKKKKKNAIERKAISVDS